MKNYLAGVNTSKITTIQESQNYFQVLFYVKYLQITMSINTQDNMTSD